MNTLILGAGCPKPRSLCHEMDISGTNWFIILCYAILVVQLTILNMLPLPQAAKDVLNEVMLIRVSLLVETGFTLSGTQSYNMLRLVVLLP